MTRCVFPFNQVFLTSFNRILNLPVKIGFSKIFRTCSLFSSSLVCLLVMLFCFLFLNYLHFGIVPFFQLWMGAIVSWNVMCEEVGRNELEHLRSFNSGLSHIILSLNCYIFCLRPFLSIYVFLSITSFAMNSRSAWLSEMSWVRGVLWWCSS